MTQEPDSILNRLAAQGLIAAGMPVERLTEGSINTVWRVRLAGGREAVLRVGPAAVEAAAGPSWMRAKALACEAIVLSRVRPAVGCVPAPVAAGFRGPGPAWLVQDAVSGRPLVAVLPALDAEARARLWRELGALARTLHGVAGAWFGTPDGRHRFPDWAGMVRADAVGMYEDAMRFEIDPAPFERLLAEIDQHGDALNEVEAPAVVHSDLDPRHVFVEAGADGWRISGVIDWEYARYVDPLSETLLVGLVARKPGDLAREAFLAGYELDSAVLDDPSLLARQRIYRGVAEGWALTDAARLYRR